MRLPIFLALLGLLTASLAHNIQMGAHQRECFHEVLHKDDKMTVTFQVGDREFGGAGNLEVDFWVGSPRRAPQAKWSTCMLQGTDLQGHTGSSMDSRLDIDSGLSYGLVCSPSYSC